MTKNLVIVESPAKAKTIEKFLGKDFTVKSSFGHIRDLEKKNFGIDINNNYKPDYKILADKKKIVADLKKDASEAETVWLASDEDREGEAISWHLYEVLKLKESNTNRIVFNEITKTAILKAIENPRKVNLDLVNAQQARRILDRLVGFELSSVLWKKIKANLSAGRVQSVSVRLLVDREREIINFKSSASFKITGIFNVDNNEGNSVNLFAELSRKFTKKDEVIDFLTKYGHSTFKIEKVEKKPTKRTPSPPFTTSTLQQEAGRKLGFSVSKTMLVAQQLYESGKITYMRTDSVNLSDTALAASKAAVIKEYGEKYYKSRNFTTKSKGAQEAHEAIRPTSFEINSANASIDENKLFELIRKRTLASQMADAQLEKTNVEISISGSKDIFVASGEIIVFDGFLKIYKASLEDDVEEENAVILPPLSKGQILDLDRIEAVEQFTKHAPRYTEAGLVRRLEELGIGRPSTYAPTISTIQKRGYVIKENRAGDKRDYTFITYKSGSIKEKIKSENFGVEKAKLFPTDIGMVVTDFLVEHFSQILDFNFTADVEMQFDDIADGKKVWYKMIDGFYKPFHATIENVIETSERNSGERILGDDPETGKKVTVRIGRFGPIVQLGLTTDADKPQFVSLPKELHLETVTLADALDILKNSGKGKELGIDPVSGKMVYARVGRFGPVIQIGENDDPEKPRYASLQPGMFLEMMTLESAMELFKLPRTVGEYEGKKVVANTGRFGPYISHDSKFASLKKTDDPMSITIERAIELILEKKEKDTARIIKEFTENKDISIIKDRWGRPCIFYKKKYFNLSKIDKPEELTLEECLKLAGVDEKKLKEKKSPKEVKTSKTTVKKTKIDPKTKKK